MNDTNQIDSWRVYWRILFDVVEGNARVQQEITIWPVSGLHRLAYGMKELSPRFVGAHTVESDRVVFNGGYIECDIDLFTDISVLATAAGLGTGPLDELSRSYDGDNVYIRADVSLLGDCSLRDFPLFHFPQPIGLGVSLSEQCNTYDGSRKVLWSISNQHYRTHEPFLLEDPAGRHGLRVRQAREGESEVFEFYVDSIPIEAMFTNPNHLFLLGPQTFYIGLSQPPTGRADEGLQGAIYHLEFDPNSSCITCPRPTFEDKGMDQSDDV